jgi:hypothetical protein
MMARSEWCAYIKTIVLFLFVAVINYILYKYAFDRSPFKGDEASNTIKLLQIILNDNDNDKTINILFYLVTVVITTATLIVAFQFFSNHQIINDIERKNKELNEKFKENEYKISRMENAINKVESLAQSTSYPIIITTNNIIDFENYNCNEYGKFIKDSSIGYSKDNIQDQANWPSILFFARLAQSSLAEKTKIEMFLRQDSDQQDIARLVAVAACKSEEYTGDREEKNILLTLAIENYSSMQYKDHIDEINLASAYARRGMLYAFLPDSYDYEQADESFKKNIKLLDKEREKELIQNANYNWGLSWLARASIFKQNPEKWGSKSFKKAINKAENYLHEANKISSIADYALLTIYSLSKNMGQCKELTNKIESEFKSTDKCIRLPKQYRIYEDIDLDFIRNKNNQCLFDRFIALFRYKKDIYNKLINLTIENDERRTKQIEKEIESKKKQKV